MEGRREDARGRERRRGRGGGKWPEHDALLTTDMTIATT